MINKHLLSSVAQLQVKVNFFPH